MATKKATNGVSERPILVTTEHRGVFFGYAKPADIDKDVIPLKRARLCVYWSADVRGFMGLAGDCARHLRQTDTQHPAALKARGAQKNRRRPHDPQVS